MTREIVNPMMIITKQAKNTATKVWVKAFPIETRSTTETDPTRRMNVQMSIEIVKRLIQRIVSLESSTG